MTRTPRHRRLALFSLCALVGCGQELSSAEALLRYDSFAAPLIGGLGGVRVSLDVRDADGYRAKLRVKVDDDTAPPALLVESPVPMQCEAGLCTLSFEIAPGTYAFRLNVFARDRCGTEARVVELLAHGGEPVTVAPRQALPLTFDTPVFAFDDDDDGIENILEPSACGRFDVPDRDRPPARCAQADHGCCKEPVSDLAGRMTRFDGSDAHIGPDGQVHTVAPFLLDSTEVTFGALERCVLAGTCLQGKPEHPVRVALESAALSRALPAVGLTPSEADEYCRWLQKRLPTDVQWDFAAAFRAPLVRARFPWDAGDLTAWLDGEDGMSGGRPASLDDDASIACDPDAPPPAANYQGPSGGCPGRHTPVGSYAQSHARRGHGAAIADLAGNAYEWTVDDSAPMSADPADARLPEGVVAVFLRGGSFDSPREFLENNFRLRISNLERDLDRVTAVAGFRCARVIAPEEDALDVEQVFVPAEEPPCAADATP